MFKETNNFVVVYETRQDGRKKMAMRGYGMSTGLSSGGTGQRAVDVCVCLPRWLGVPRAGRGFSDPRLRVGPRGGQRRIDAVERQDGAFELCASLSAEQGAMRWL